MPRATHPAVVHYALEPNAVELREIAVPEIGDDDVLLEVGAVSVCGSDVHQSRNTHSWPVNIPVVLGHEFGGTVAQVGRAVRGFREGDRVVSETAAHICGECLLCRTGRYNLCPTRKGFGYGLDGAMAQWVRVPGPLPASTFPTRCRSTSRVSPSRTRSRTRRCASIPRFVPETSSSCSVPARSACCARAWRRSSGADPLIVAGLSADAPRLEAARRLGATRTVDIQTENLDEVVRGFCDIGADLVCDASGASRPLGIALGLTRPDGQVTKVGWSPDDDSAGRQSAGAAQPAAPGILQSQLSGVGARDSPARSRRDAAGRRSSACARRSTAGGRRSTRCTRGA